MTSLAISEYCDRVYCLERNVSENTAYLMTLSCRMFEDWSKGPVMIAEMRDEPVSLWIRDLQRGGKLAPRTIHGRRGDLLCVWRYAYFRGDCPVQPIRVRSVKVPTPNPVAWTVDELSRIVAACQRFTGHLGNGLPRRLYFPALLTFVYETGVRRSDAWRITLDMLRDDGTVIFVQHKTGTGHVAKIRGETLESVRSLASLLRAMGDSRWREPLRWPATPKMIYHWIDQAKAAAGVSADGALQQLRRTGATHCERLELGSGTRYLGHKSPELARRHYIDASQAYPDRPLPPALDGSEIP